MTLYSLTDDELVILDGRCRPETQRDVDSARARLAMAASNVDLSSKEAGFIADVVGAAKRDGRLTFVRLSIRSCDVCGATGGYAKFKAGRRRGQDNRDRPLRIGGVDLARGFVVIDGRATLGCCEVCWQKLRERVANAIADLQAEIPEAVTGRPPAWKRQFQAKCTQCGWSGHEGELRELPAVISGRYRGGCPSCPAENKAFGPTLIDISSKDFVVVPVGVQA